MNSRIFPVIVVLCFCLTLFAFPASAAAPKPGENPPASPEPLAPLAPLTPLRPLAPTTDIVFTVLPRNPPVVKVCTNKDRVFSPDIYEVPHGMSLKNAVAKNKARRLLTPVRLTIQEDGKTIDTATSDLIGRFQTWTYRPTKSGDHVLTFTAETDTIQATQTVNVKAALCQAELNIHFKESVHTGQHGILPNQFTVNIHGQIEADENGEVKPGTLEGSFQIWEDVAPIEAQTGCSITLPDMSGQFAVSVSGAATEDSIDLKLESEPIQSGPYTFSFVCPKKSFTKQSPAKSFTLDAMQVVALSFPPDGGSSSFSLSHNVRLVGSGLKYADATVSLEAVD